MKKILITGITGQDGSYMLEYCLNLGHKVYGMVRRTAQIHDANFKHLYSNPNFERVYGDLSDGTSLNGLVESIQPDYFINFASQSFVGASWDIPEETFMSGAVGVLKCLEAIRKYAPNCRFYNAGSSEQFGDVLYSPQDESHPFRPRSPYGAAKASASHLVKVYRESYGLYAVQGLLFNHESERRGEEFVTRKITKGIANIVAAINHQLPIIPIELGNLDARRDWSHAEDFVDGVWRMLNQDKFNPNFTIGQNEFWTTSNISKHIKEYILASGETHTIREFVEKACFHAGIDNFVWDGEGQNEKLWYQDKYNNPHVLVSINPKFYRPAEVDLLLGNPERAKEELQWKPKISFDNLVKRMVNFDLYERGVCTIAQDPA